MRAASNRKKQIPRLLRFHETLESRIHAHKETINLFRVNGH